MNYPKKLHVYMTMDKYKINKMVNEQIMDLREKMFKNKILKFNFPFQLNLNYPGKLEKIDKNNFIKLIAICHAYSFTPSTYKNKTVESDDLTLWFYASQAYYSNIYHHPSTQSIINMIKKVCGLVEASDNEIHIWYQRIKHTYVLKKWDGALIELWNEKCYLLDKHDNESMHSTYNKYKKYAYNYKNKHIYEFRKHFAKFSKYWWMLVYCFDEDINEYNISQELIDLLHNYNYHNICCKIIMRDLDIDTDLLHKIKVIMFKKD